MTTDSRAPGESGPATGYSVPRTHVGRTSTGAIDLAI